MVRRGTKVSHVLELKAAKLAIMSFTLKERDAKSVRIRIDNMTVLFILNENWGYHKPGADCCQPRDLAIPFETKEHDDCRILNRVNECGGREGIQTNQGFQQMETKLSHLHEIVSDTGNIRDGPVCLEGVTPITPVHVLENRPFQSR